VIIVGLDLSLTSTGVAHLAPRPSAGVVLDRVTSEAPKTDRHPRTGNRLPPTLQQRDDRLDTLARQIVDLATGADLVVIEAPAYSSKTGSMHDRSGLWWLVVNRLHRLDLRVVEVTSGGRAKYATGKGTASKDVVMLAAANRYRNLVEVTGNDVADALILAAMGARHLGQPIEDSLPQTHLAAMDNVAWPALEATA
jgi:crossover junction endodeoxyribonuclease RuvC